MARILIVENSRFFVDVLTGVPSILFGPGGLGKSITAVALAVSLETGLEIRLAPRIGEGMKVKIQNGPLRGIEGWVEKRYGMSTVLEWSITRRLTSSGTRSS